MSLLALFTVALAQQPAAPPIQRPTGATTPAPTSPAPVAPAPASPAPLAPSPATPTSPSPVAPVAPTPAAPVSPSPAAPTSPSPVAPAPVAPAPVAPAPGAPVPADMSSATAPTPERAGPPHYTAADMSKLRQRYGLELDPPTTERKPLFRCLVADPTCGFVVEVNATSAYGYRLRQGSKDEANILKWSSARVQYDVWFSIPTMVETRGKFRYTRLSLGPKGGIIASDSRDIWGNIGLAGRYWFSRKRFAPNLEFTSALVFKVAGNNREGNFDNVRGPVGFTADVGFGIGGFGSIVVGGQFDAPLAREGIAEVEYASAGGMFFLGFRGNIVWGAPAALAVGTHAIANRSVRAP